MLILAFYEDIKIGGFLAKKKATKAFFPNLERKCLRGFVG